MLLTVVVVVGFDVFAPVVVAGVGDLPLLVVEEFDVLNPEDEFLLEDDEMAVAITFIFVRSISRRRRGRKHGSVR